MSRRNPEFEVPSWMRKPVDRRRFLGMTPEAAAAVGAGGIALTAAAVAARRFDWEGRNLLEPTYDAKKIYEEVTIRKFVNGEPLNVRHAPNASKDTAVYSWSDIIAIGGERVRDLDSITLKNVLVALGDNPDAEPTPGEWLVLPFQYKFNQKRTGFISKSKRTFEWIEVKGEAQEFRKTPNGLYVGRGAKERTISHEDLTKLVKPRQAR